MPHEHQGCLSECLPRPPTPELTILVKEEEEEGVHNGDEDPTPERDAVGWQGGLLALCPLAESGHGGGWGSPRGGSPAS